MTATTNARVAITSGAVWTAATVGPPDVWTYTLDDDLRGDIVAATHRMREHGTTLATITAGDFDVSGPRRAPRRLDT
jgi:hypothetical protein